MKDHQLTAWNRTATYRHVPDYGPEKQTAFFYRFLMSAEDLASPSGSLHFTSLYRWIGRCREVGVVKSPETFERLLDMLGSNDLVSSTNEMEANIFALPNRTDVIEVRAFNEIIERRELSTIMEWWRQPLDEKTPSRMFAWTRMRTSAVRVRGHGQIERIDWPDFFFEFLKNQGGNGEGRVPGPEMINQFGDLLYQSTFGPKVKNVVCEIKFDTSMEDSNLVGNLYFANYGVWQGRARDGYFYSVTPKKYFQNRGVEGELACVETSMQQLRDAMPFDRIQVQLHIYALWERAVDFRINYFRVEDDGKLVKIAAGKHVAVWAIIERGAPIVPLPWPKEIRDALLRDSEATKSIVD